MVIGFIWWIVGGIIAVAVVAAASSDSSSSNSSKKEIEKELEVLRKPIDEKVEEIQTRIDDEIKSFKTRVKAFDKQLRMKASSIQSIVRFDIDRFENTCKQKIDNIKSNIKKTIDSEFNSENARKSCNDIIKTSDLTEKNKKRNTFRQNVIRKVIDKAYSDIEAFFNETKENISEICKQNFKIQQNTMLKQKKDLEQIANDSNKQEAVILDSLFTIANAKILIDLTDIKMDKYYFHD